MELAEIMTWLAASSNPDNVAGMARYGINSGNSYGVSMPELRRLGKTIGRDHALALELWSSGVHEARILAALVDDPAQVTEAQMESWVQDLDSWDVCDQLCSNLFDRTAFAYAKAMEWSARRPEFVKRAGFVLMAALAVHDKHAPDEAFLAFLPAIVREASDERNFVKKAVNWALRQIGKRNTALNQAAIETAETVRAQGTSTARWIAADALRELRSEAVQERLRRPR
jgi:3-methyladenine DNA glycosylase AlkD